MRTIILLSKDRCFANLYGNGLTFLQRIILNSNRSEFTTIGDGKRQLAKWCVPMEHHRLMGFVVPNIREFQRRRPSFVKGVRNVGNLQIQMVGLLNSGFPNKRIFCLGSHTKCESSISNLNITFFRFRAHHGNTIVWSVTMDLSIEKGGRNGIQSRHLTFLTNYLISNMATMERRFENNGSVPIHNRRITLTFLYIFVTTHHLWMGLGSYINLQTFRSALVKFIHVLAFKGVQIWIIHVLRGLSVTMSRHLHGLILNNVRFRFVGNQKDTGLVSHVVRGVTNT